MQSGSNNHLLKELLERDVSMAETNFNNPAFKAQAKKGNKNDLKK